MSGASTAIAGERRSPFFGPNRGVNPLRAIASSEKRTFGWGVKLYPSGEFALYRKRRDEATKRFEKAFAFAGYGILKGRHLLDVQNLYGEKTIRGWFSSAKNLVVPRLRSQETDTVKPLALMGLSASANSLKKRRGLGGITSYGRNLVREAAYAIQDRYGKERLSFWTCTLPEMSKEDTEAVCRNWGKIMSNLRRKLVYHLKIKGLPTHVVGVTELQPDRWRKERYPAWHIHWLFVGANKAFCWKLDTSLTDALWSDAVHVYCKRRYDFSQSCRLESIRKSAGGYMAKYMSKGGGAITEVEAAYPGCVPASWYVATASLKDWVKKSTRTSIDTARWIHQTLLDSIDDIVAPWAFRLEVREGVEIAVCWLGRLKHPPSPPLGLLWD